MSLSTWYIKKSFELKKKPDCSPHHPPDIGSHSATRYKQFICNAPLKTNELKKKSENNTHNLFQELFSPINSRHVEKHPSSYK